ncbi:MAG: hypothetical protein GY851_18285, partial [bacterium]|nr:hypothetical protein [bacterium]
MNATARRMAAFVMTAALLVCLPCAGEEEPKLPTLDLGMALVEYEFATTQLRGLRGEKFEQALKSLDLRPVSEVPLETKEGKQVGQVRLSVGHVESSVWVVVIGTTWEAVAGILGVDKEDLDGFRVDVTMEYEMPLPGGSEPGSPVFRAERKRGQLDKRGLRWKRFPVLDWDDLYISLT